MNCYLLVSIAHIFLCYEINQNNDLTNIWFYLVYFHFCHEQAYTMELEAEVAKLKEQNKELQEKQVIR
jgi:hypothetical protein